LGIVSATRISNPHEFFTFQNFKSIIEYAKNESDYTRRIVDVLVEGIVGGIVWGIMRGIVGGIVWGIMWEIVLGSV
jgi:LytS/YehU family sensor histidine kinase